MSFKDFENQYKAIVVDLLADTTVKTSPIEHKKAVYILTNYYPELVDCKYPWYANNNITEFGLVVNETYKKIKYNSFIVRLYNLYYCRFRCCRKKYNNGNPSLRILNH